MSNKKQTAVEWLFDQLPDHLRLSRTGFEMLNQAKEIDKLQKEQAFNTGKVAQVKENYSHKKIPPPQTKMTFEQYYTETYGGE